MSGSRPSEVDCRNAISSQQLRDLQGFEPCYLVIPKHLADVWRSTYGDLPGNVRVAETVITGDTAAPGGPIKRTFAEELADLIDQMPAPMADPESPKPRGAQWKRERLNRYSSR